MHDVIVVGAGPAGALAATFLARAKLDTLVVDADQGVTRRAWVANLLGFPDGIPGPELVERGLQQLERAGAKLVKGKAASLEKAGEGFVITLEDGARHEAKQVLLATGFAFELAEKAGIETLPGTEPYVKRVLKTDSDGQTSLRGVWAAGTVGGVSVHVAITAADGARVATNLVSALKGERWVDHESLPAKS
jgi:thioredoxin reductase